MSDQFDEEDRKLFVGGLPQEATQDDLEEYFKKFGELESCKLKMDSMTGRSRGFAFLLYTRPEGVEAASAVSNHEIKGKKNITVKKADVKQGKVYVGKLPASGVGEDEIREHFAEFGAIAEVIRPIDKSKDNEPKNFCFVTFEKERVAKKLIEQGTCSIKGHSMQIKQVTPNPRDPSQRGGRGGFGGGRGGYGGSPWMDGGYGGGYGGGWGGQGGYGGGWGGDGYGAQGGYGGGYSGGYGGGFGGGMGGGYGGGGKMRGGPRGGRGGAPY